MAAFSCSFIYDCIGPLARLLSAQLKFSNAEIGMLQAVCSLPNLAMTFLGGYLIDRVGVRRAVLVFAGFCLAGAAITPLSPRLGSMLSGRLVYGLGSGSLTVAINTGIASWFEGRRAGLMFGLNLTLTRLGTMAAMTGPAWAPWAYGQWRHPLLLAALVGALGVLAACAYSLLVSRLTQRCDRAAPGEGGRRSWRGILAFEPSFWLLACLCVTFYGALFPFHTFAQKYLVEAHGVSNAQASLLTATPTCMALVATPFVGWLVDRVGHRLGFLILGSSLMFAAFLAFCSCRVMPVLPILLMGASYALVPTVMWPSVARIVPSGDMGKAYGLMAWFESLGLGGCNLLIGWVHDRARAGAANPHGYQAGMGLLSILMLLGLLFTLRIRRKRL